MQAHIVLAGGSGFLGRALEEYFTARGRRVSVLTRSASKPNHIVWDGKTVGAWAAVLDGASALVNLTGKNANCRHTPENKREIVSSRVNSVRALDEALARCAHPPSVWVQSGGIDIVGDGPVARDERTQAATSFLAEVCVAWEAAFAATKAPTRRAYLRIGPVLGWGGGPFPPLHKIAQLFLGGPVGGGRQHFSWVHVRDVVRMVAWAIDTPTAQGIYNVVAPSPVTNRKLMETLRCALGRPWSPPAPAFAIRIAARVIGTEADLLLGGSHAVPARLLAEGFVFQFPELSGAVKNLIDESAKLSSALKR